MPNGLGSRRHEISAVLGLVDVKDRTIRRKMKTLRRKRVENREDANEIMMGDGNEGGDGQLRFLFELELDP